MYCLQKVNSLIPPRHCFENEAEITCFLKLAFKNYLFIVCTCTWRLVGTQCCQFPAYTQWVRGVELWPPGLATGAFSCWTPSQLFVI